jgi:CubicO group peptidase (beta-lactamase class C family)
MTGPAPSTLPDLRGADPPLDARGAGFDAAALAAVDATLSGLIERGRLPGAVTLVLRDGRLAAFSAHGQVDPQRGAPMRRDSIFRIHSMTKPVASVALLRLVEQGKALLSDPVARYVPAFARTMVHVDTPTGPRRLPPLRAITLHDLLRHTAGLTYEFLGTSPVHVLYQQFGFAKLERTNAERADDLASLPLLFEPGSAWEYSRATDVIGRVIEVLAGETLGEHLKRSLFEPLGMVDTGFHVPAADHDRIAMPFAADPDGGAAMKLHDVRRPRSLESAGGGLVSTAADYARFLQMLLAGGTLDGLRVLGRSSVAHMTSDHLGGIPVRGDMLPPGHGFGLGVAVRLATGLAALPGSPGTWGWGGIAGTVFFVDPIERLVAILLVQAPNQRIEVQELFRTQVYAALA